MISKPLIGGIVVLLLLLVAAGVQLKSAYSTVGELGAQNRQFEESLRKQAEAYKELAVEKELSEKLSLEAVRGRATAFRRMEGYKEEVRRLKRENEDIHAYYASYIPGLVAQQLWAQSCGAEDREGLPASCTDRTNTEAQEPVRTIDHEEGWGWCKAVEVALDSCNDDKRLLREWVGSVD